MTDDYVELTAADLAHRWRERSVLESVDEAVIQADETEEYATPDSALRWLLVLTWTDLQSARGNALNGRCSMACDDLVCRIVGLTRLVGPLSWGHLDVDLLLDGVYERIHEAIGVPTPLSDDDRQQAQAVKERRNVSGTRTPAASS
jgi:hypothetical protein